jgi:hypothetical protein
VNPRSFHGRTRVQFDGERGTDGRQGTTPSSARLDDDDDRDRDAMRQARGPAVATRIRACMRRTFALLLAVSLASGAGVSALSSSSPSSSAPPGQGNKHGAAGGGTGGGAGGSTGAASSSNLQQQQQQLKIAFVTGNAMKVCIVAVQVVKIVCVDDESSDRYLTLHVCRRGR